jgi:S1-C subfamily serine protease
MIRYGRALTPKVGIHLSDDNRWEGSAPRLVYVVPNSPAEKAGLDAFLGCSIVRVDGKKVQKSGDLVSVLDSKNVRDAIRFTFKVAESDGRCQFMTIPVRVSYWLDNYQDYKCLDDECESDT